MAATETRDDTQRMIELEDMSNEFFHGIKPTYEYTFNGQRKRTGCARCAAMLDDSVDWSAASYQTEH